jgi:hypothetical protein
LGTTVKNKNLILEEIKMGQNSSNACYHSVQNLSSSPLLSKKVNIRIYKTIILPVVLYGCKTLSLTLREENGLRMFDNRVLRIFGPRRDEVTGGQRKLHNKELDNLYMRSSPSIITIIKLMRMRWAGHVTLMGEKRKEYMLSVESQKERTTRKTKTWVVKNIKMDLREMEWSGIDWIGLAQDRDKRWALVNAVLNLCIP